MRWSSDCSNDLNVRRRRLNLKKLVLLFFQCATDWSYKSDLSKHQSQVDASKGFGGKYGVQEGSVDKVHIS